MPQTPDNSVREVVHYRGVSAKTAAFIGTVGFAAGAVGGWMLHDTDIEPAESYIEIEKPIEVQPFVPDGITCFGLTGQRINASLTRDNKIDVDVKFVPSFLEPEINTPDDRYSTVAVVLGEFCVGGFVNFGPEAPVRTETQPDGSIDVHIDQSKGALFINRPAIDARTCTDEEKEAGERNCLIIDGQDSAWTDAGEGFFKIFGVDDEDNIPENLLSFVQVVGTDPTCIEQALQVEPLPNLLYATYQQQVVEQGLMSAEEARSGKLRLHLYDKYGEPTETWDSSEQRARYQAAKADFESRMGENMTLDYNAECDTQNFGVLYTPEPDEVTL